MGEMVINKEVKGGRFRSETFTCQCGVLVQRANSRHKYCSKCARESILQWRTKKIERFFPVLNESYSWLPEYFLGDYYHADHRDEEERSTIKARKEREKPIPCNSCTLMKKCATDELMCRQFFNYTKSDLKNPTMESGRREPKRYYYQKSFNLQQSASTQRYNTP